MRKIIFFIFIYACTINLVSAKPLIGIVNIKSDSPRSGTIAKLLDTHLANIIGSTLVFNQINSRLMMDQLTRFDCLEESCTSRFARKAGLSVLITGSVEDKGDSLTLNLHALGLDAPYFGTVIYRYAVSVPLTGLRLMARQYSYICEEHSAHFISRLLYEYKTPITLKTNKNQIIADKQNIISGIYDLYRYKPLQKDEIKIYNRIGRARITNNKVKAPQSISIKDGDFVFIKNDDKARNIDEFYNGRKREIVFSEPSLSLPCFIKALPQLL